MQAGLQQDWKFERSGTQLPLPQLLILLFARAQVIQQDVQRSKLGRWGHLAPQNHVSCDALAVSCLILFGVHNSGTACRSSQAPFNAAAWLVKQQDLPGLNGLSERCRSVAHECRSCGATEDSALADARIVQAPAAQLLSDALLIALCAADGLKVHCQASFLCAGTEVHTGPSSRTVAAIVTFDRQVQKSAIC